MITTATPAPPPAPEQAVSEQAIPARLIREVLNGKPLYYKGYREVLQHRATPEEIMGSSDLQSIIVGILYGSLWNKIDRKQYRLVTSEAGLHLSRGNNLSADIAIFDKASLPALKGKYFDVPPKVMIEVDIRIDWDESSEVNYVLEKSQVLFDFGVERLLWVLTASRKVIILQPGQDAVITNWSNNVPVLDGCVLNIQTLLDEEEITF